MSSFKNDSLFRDISFLYDAKVVADRAKPLSSFARSRVETAASKEVTRVGDHGMKTPQLEVLDHSPSSLKNFVTVYDNILN